MPIASATTVRPLRMTPMVRASTAGTGPVAVLIPSSPLLLLSDRDCGGLRLHGAPDSVGLDPHPVDEHHAVVGVVEVLEVVGREDPRVPALHVERRHVRI